MNIFNIPAALVSALVLAACAVPTPTSGPSATAAPTTQSTPAERATQTPNTIVATATASSPAATTQNDPNNDANEDLTRTDEQGAVVVKVKPLNLGDPRETLDFDITLETHSVDLSMDFAALTTLTTDNGRSVPAAKWDGPAGGHHVEGKVLFPAEQGGAPVLEGATRLTLTLRNVDAPERTFTWDLQ